MRDKDLVALLTLAFFLLYFIPSTVMKFISIGFLLFFSTGFFTLKFYRDMEGEELLLLSPPLGLAISGSIALALAALSILTKETMLISIGMYLVITYVLSKGEEFKLNLNPRGLDRLVTIILVLSLVVGASWIYAGLSVEKYKEVDIAIEEWPHNVTLNSTLEFHIYIKNWDYDNASFRVVFKLNNETKEIREFSLAKGGEMHMYFYTNTSTVGTNLASFDLYVNGNFYTNVHVYFLVKP